MVSLHFAPNSLCNFDIKHNQTMNKCPKATVKQPQDNCFLTQRTEGELDVPVSLFFRKAWLSALQPSITTDSDLRSICYPGRRTYFDLSSVIPKDEFTIAI